MDRTLGIVGAGLMGRSIALRAVQSGLEVRLYDVQPDTCAAAIQTIADQTDVADGALTVAESPSALAECDLLIEAVVENRAVKRRLLQLLSALSPTALIATNTSSLSIAELSESVDRAERFCGLHFCHPIPVCPLVEIVPGPATTPATLNRAESFVQRIQLSPLRTRDVPGFTVNRLLFPYLEAAIALIRGGVDWNRIEDCATDFGMRLGPLSQMDEIGIDVILRAAAAFHRGNPVVPPQSELLLAMYQSGRLGRKSGRGFFNHTSRQDRRLPDPDSIRLVATHASSPVDCPDSELQFRLFVPMLASACELLERGVVAGESEVRAALREGLGCRGEAADLPGWGRKLGGPVLVEWQERLRLAKFEPALWG